MEVTDLSELCRLCLDSSNILFPFETTLLYTPRSLPQLIKYCLDIDCSGNDGGIAPKNVCQSCIEKLQMVFEFKSKSQESDKYLKQIISHSTVQTESYDEPSYPDDEESLLQPMDDDYEEQHNGSATKKDKLPRRGHRTGEFECQICSKSFRYVKALNNHMKIHKQQKSGKVNYYQRKKMMQAAGIVKSPPKATAPRYKKEAQADYDSISPYNSPALYEHEPTHQQRDSSPDFGDLMLSTSQMIGDEVAEEVERELPKTSRTGRVLKRPIQDNELLAPNGGQKRIRNRPSILPKKTSTPVPAKAPPKKVEDVASKKPGPASSKTRSKPTPPRKKSEDAEEGFAIEGFSEVDITKMLKKSKNRDRMIELIDDGSQSQKSSASTRSRSRSPSVELIPEVDIFGRG